MAYLLAVIVALVVVNLMNNRLAPWAYVLTCPAATVLLLVIFRQGGSTPADAGLAADAAGRGAAWGLVGVGLVAVGFLAAALAPATRGAFVDRRMARAGWGDVAYQLLIRIPLGTVLLEEMAFRGVLYGMLRGEYGVIRATAASSVLFGLWHVLPALPLTELNAAAGRVFGVRRAVAVAVAVVAATLAGVVLCAVREYAGSLLAPMAVHWATNGLGYLIAFLAGRWLATPAHPGSTAPERPRPGRR